MRVVPMGRGDMQVLRFWPNQACDSSLRDGVCRSQYFLLSTSRFVIPPIHHRGLSWSTLRRSVAPFLLPRLSTLPDMTSVVSSTERDAGGRPEKCRVCGASFKDRSNRAAHERTVHSNTRPFACSEWCVLAGGDLAGGTGRRSQLKAQRCPTSLLSMRRGACWSWLVWVVQRGSDPSGVGHASHTHAHTLARTSMGRLAYCDACVGWGIITCHLACHSDCRFKTKKHLAQHASVHTVVKPHACPGCVAMALHAAGRVLSFRAVAWPRGWEWAGRQRVLTCRVDCVCVCVRACVCVCLVYPACECACLPLLMQRTWAGAPRRTARGRLPLRTNRSSIALWTRCVPCGLLAGLASMLLCDMATCKCSSQNTTGSADRWR